MTDQGLLDPRIGEVLSRLEEEIDELARAIAATLRRDVPAYSQIPVEVIVAGIREDTAAAVAGLAAGGAPGNAELDTAARVGAERAEQGVPIDALLQAFRVGGREIVARARMHATDLEVPTETLLDVIERGLAWLDAVSVRAAQGHRDAELTHLRADVHRRAAFLHAALHGTLPVSELRAQAAAIGLDPAAKLSALRARPTAELPAHRLQALLAEWGGGDLIGVVDGDVGGIVVKPPDLRRAVVAGLGPAVPVERIAESYASASQALTAAIAFGRTGTHLLEDLALEAAVLDDRIGGALERRCLGPLDALGEKGAPLEHTLRVFLTANRRFEQAANELSIHPNTLRHRLARYGELTGLDLRNTEALVATWTALEHRRIRLAEPM